jgi:hypothetical protein
MRSPTISYADDSAPAGPCPRDRLAQPTGVVLQLGGDRIIADNVVVATGFGRTPSIPDFA